MEANKQSSAEAVASFKWIPLVKGDIPEHFDPFRSSLSQSHITRETVIYRDCRNQERNGTGGPPTLGLQTIGLPYQTN